MTRYWMPLREALHKLDMVSDLSVVSYYYFGDQPDTSVFELVGWFAQRAINALHHVEQDPEHQEEQLRFSLGQIVAMQNLLTALEKKLEEGKDAPGLTLTSVSRTLLQEAEALLAKVDYPCSPAGVRS